VSSSHAVCAKGLYIAMISTTVETDKPELEIRPALDLLGNIQEMFVKIHTLYEPTDDGKKDNVSLPFGCLILFFSCMSLKAMMPNLISRVPVRTFLNSMRELQVKSLT